MADPVRSEVEVVVVTAQHGVADRPADQRELMAGGREELAQLVDDRADPVELRGHRALHVGHGERRRDRAGGGVGHEGSV